jgi:hypothetical protein
VANPEQGPQEQGVLGTWQTVSLEIPDFLEPVRQAVDAFFSFLIQILNILIGLLEVLKVFATGLLDPIIAVIEALRDLIETILNDLRQLGIYIHGDYYSLVGPDFQSLRGGYLGYEGRMVARLTDTGDANRPDISELSSCIAVFLFVQADIRGINRIVQLIRSILRLFNRRYPLPRMMNQVSNVQATYGYDGATIFSFNKGFFKGFDLNRTVDQNLSSPYNAVNLTWEMAPIPGAPWPDRPILPPAGFLVEFSTLEQPIQVVCERPIEGVLETLELTNQPAKVEIVNCKDDDGNPILLHGGVQQLDLRGAIDWNDAVTLFGDRKPDAVRVYGIKNLSDRAPIQLSDMQEGGKFYLQRTFFVPFAQNIFFPGRGFGATFQFDDMPFAAEWDLVFGNRLQRKNDNRQPEEFFVRVRAVNRSVKSPTDYSFLVDQTSLRDRDGPVLPMTRAPNVDLNDAGPPSFVTKIIFPDASTQLYLRAVAEALAIMALSRSDLPVLIGKDAPVNFPPVFGVDVLANGLLEPYWGAYEDHARLTTGLEEVAKFLMIQVVGRRYVKKFFGDANASVAKFRRRLFINCINLTNRFLTQNLPPLPARQLAVEIGEDLLNFRVLFDDGKFFSTVDPAFTDTTLEGGTTLELLRSADLLNGVAPNPLALGIPDGRGGDRIAVTVADQTVLPRSPHFFFAAQGESNRGRGSFDMAPVIYSRQGARLNQIAFFRNLVPDTVYAGAQFVLQVAAGPQVRSREQGWIAFRMFPQGLPAIDRFFDQILALLRSIQAAIESIAETILRFIEYLQSRLRELQAFLNRINALIQRLLRFFLSIVPAAGLVVVAPGTNGVTTALLASQKKPISPANPAADSYGGGLVLFAGGIPNLALDVFRALFKGDT